MKDSMDYAGLRLWAAVGLVVAMLFGAALMALVASGPLEAAGTSSAPADSSASAEMQAAQAELDAGDYGSAVPILQAAVTKDPGNADAWNLLGYAHRKSGDLAAAGPAYEKALALDPGHRGALEYQGELFLMLDEPEKARANLARLGEVCPRGCEELTELEEAIDAYEAARKRS
ncbi:MAG: tetratricopeptide repeat protein [Alphaproteobacteria bacterium]|nr:tetratricopeptide repeat protein [Alphaproteobacteria bacterium]MDX5368132.1 tetratricopeptide repeat protein [Alphaproteobacteria bacterium]MDX5462963.1 tetratricopeptide repeat protein [Alphaproteobacteria bacterium]